MWCALTPSVVDLLQPAPHNLAQERQKSGANEEDQHKDSLYADDVTAFIIADNDRDFRERAKENASRMKEILARMSLKLDEQKSKILFLSPQRLPNGMYGRDASSGVLPTARRLRQLYELIAKSDAAVLEFDLLGEAVLSKQGERHLEYPFKPEEDIKVLGLTLDYDKQWDGHFAA